MPKNRAKSCFLMLCLAVCLVFEADCACAVSAIRNAAPMRLALVAGGPARDYQVIFQGMIKELAARGVIARGDVSLPADDADMAPLWTWLSENAGGDRLKFPADAYYSPDWNAEERPLIRARLLERIRERKDIDCILAFGTWAGQDFSSEELPVPVLVFSVTNAVEAGIIPSVEDSGRDHLLAVIEPGRFARQIRVFHDIFAFKRLGLAYEDTPSGRSGIAFNEIVEEAKNLGVNWHFAHPCLILKMRPGPRTTFATVTRNWRNREWTPFILATTTVCCPSIFRRCFLPFCKTMYPPLPRKDRQRLWVVCS